jgi:ankyrin repeat protein
LRFNDNIKGYFDIIQYLVVEKGADVNAKSNNGTTILFAAVFSGDLKVVQYLVEKGADVNAKNKDGLTPLDVTGNKEIKKFLQNAGGKSGEDIK